MLEQIMEVISGEAGSALKEKVGLSDEQAKGAISVAGESAMEAVSSQLMSGGLDTVMNLFSSKSNSKSADGLSGVIASLMTQKLSEKVGLDSKKIAPVVGMLLPVLLNFVSKKNEETPDDDASPIENLFGGSEQGKDLMDSLGGALSKFF